MIYGIVVCFLLGWLLQNKIQNSRTLGKRLDKYVLNIALPFLIISKISVIDLEGRLLLPMYLAWGVMASCTLIILVLGRIFNWPSTIVGALLLVAVLGNTSFLGLGVVENVLGTSYVSSALVFDQLGTFLALTIYGSFITTRYGNAESGLLTVVRKIFQFVPFLALLACMPLYFFPLNKLLLDSFSNIGQSVGPVAMFAVGLRFTITLERRVMAPALSGLVIKMILMPSILYVFAWLTGSVGVVAWDSSVLQSAMPPMVTAGILAVGAGFDDDLVAFMVGVGTLGAVLTLSMWSLVL